MTPHDNLRALRQEVERLREQNAALIGTASQWKEIARNLRDWAFAIHEQPSSITCQVNAEDDECTCGASEFNNKIMAIFTAGPTIPDNARVAELLSPGKQGEQT